MATRSEAQLVKSLNKSSGRQRFVFKKFSERIAEINIDVYKSLEPLNAEPSPCSSFFRDCLVEWRELNTAEDFISFYQEIFPFVQTLPQIILQKELIVSKLLSRLQMKSRLSLEPILRLISALSRDLLEDFLPFLQRIVISLVFLLKSGADREPEIMEQIFKTWSYIMMYLQKYLTKDVVHILKVTSRLRFYPKDYVQEFMAESVSFILRNAPLMQLKKGIRKVLIEVAKTSSDVRKHGVSELLWYAMRGTSSRLHSRAQEMLHVLMDKSVYYIRGQLMEGSNSVLEVINSVFHRLSVELEAADMNLVWSGLFEKIMESVASECTLQLNRLLSMLLATMHNGYMMKTPDYKPVVQLVKLLVETYVTPCSLEAENPSTELSEKILHLLLVVLDGLSHANDLSALSHISIQWAPVFNLRNTSLLTFIKGLLLKDAMVLRIFQLNIVSALNGLVEISEEEVIYLLLIFCEKLQMPKSGLLDGIPEEKLSRICNFIHQNFTYWIGMINNAIHRKLSSLESLEDSLKLALLWGTVRCYPYIFDGQKGLSSLMNLLNALEDLLMIDCGFPRSIWQSLIGATLDSYGKVLHRDGTGNDGCTISKFLYLAKKYSSSPQVLCSVADMLDSLHGSMAEAQHNCKSYYPELKAVNLVDALKTFGENLCHSNGLLRVSTLRILCHYEPLKLETFSQEQSNEKTFGDGVAQPCQIDDRDSNVMELLLLIESTPISVDTSRKVILLLSKIQKNLSATRIAVDYIPALLYGIFGIFHKRFSYLWNPAMDCLAFLINQHFEIVWDKYILYLDHCESRFLSPDQTCRNDAELFNMSSDLVGYFKSSIGSTADSTPCSTVLSLLIQTLQKVPRAEFRSRDIMPLFLKFVGYSTCDIMSLEIHAFLDHKGKDWKFVLKEWLNIFRGMRNPRSFYQSQFYKDILQYRLLDDNDAEMQMKVLDCLLNWKDDFLLPYAEHLRNLINAKNLREELTTWSLSTESNLIDEQHRRSIVPIVIRILVAKVRKLKTLASRKHASVCHRRAVLGFLTQLDVHELPLFFALLMRPLQTGADVTSRLLWYSSDFLNGGFGSVILQQFTTDGIKALSWKKIYGFLHVTEEVLEVFDEFHVSPFLDLLMGCIVRILESCTNTLDTKRLESSLTDSGRNSSFDEHDGGVETEIMLSTSGKQFKEMRSLCLKIISSALGRYDSYDFGCEFWDRFFAALKPLIAGFKQEGASSEKPSSLFSCFLAMSRSLNFVSLLSREKYLVPDIFSMLTVSSASDAIISGVFKFVDNLLSLDSELDDANSSVKIVLLPHLDVLICSLHSLFTCDNATKRKVVRNPGEKELTVFKLLTKYIKEPLAARKFVDILLPLLAKRSQKISDSCVDILQIIQHVVKVVGSEISEKIISSVSPLLTFAQLEVRTAVCSVLTALSESDSSVLIVAKLLSELNATAAMETGGLDYDTVIGAYEKINKDLLHSLQKEHVLIFLSHAVHDMSSEEMILRQSGYGLLVCFVELAREVIDGKESNQGSWSEAGIKQIINNFILKHMGDAMSNETSVQKVWIDLLRVMAIKLTSIANFESYGTLYSQDPEQDFFSNIIHLQKHRRARALTRFSHAISSRNLSEVITNGVFVPLFFNMLFDLEHGKGEHVRSACLEALASISGCMSWKQYYLLLNRCFREMALKPDKQKVLLRLVYSILDYFHFPGSGLNQKPDGFIEKESEQMSSAEDVADIQTCLGKRILPKIQKLLNSGSDSVNVNISLVALKLLKLLPGETMNLQLPSIIHRISNFLKNRLDSVRDEARSALASCLKELGLEYLQFIVKVLRGTLKRGYELHVLGYTLNFLLSKFPANSICGKLDYCLDDLLSVIEDDVLGDVSEQKEEEKFASKMKETRKQKSFETLKLIAQSITFRTNALKLLSPITVHLKKQLTPKLKTKLESMLNHIAAGVESNPSVNMTELFVFVYRLIKNGIDDGGLEEKYVPVLKTGKPDRSEVDIRMNNSNRLVEVDPRYSHFITVFALGLLQNYMKNLKLSKKNEELLSLLDPFIGMLCDCLGSKYENIVSTALRCLSHLVRLPLPSLESEGDRIKTSLLVIAQGSGRAGNPMMESCLRLLTVLLRNTQITLSTDQLHMLIQFPIFVDIERNPSFIALSLLKAVVNRKLVVPEIYDVVKQIAELMVRSQDEPVRKKCSQILLQFLMDYHLSEKRLQQHIDFLLANLRYEHSTGREAVLEMLHAIIMKFPANVIDGQSQTLFVHLVVCLANDTDNKVRSMAGTVIKLLIGRLGPHSLHSISQYSLSWYLGEKQHLWSAAAQVLGLLIEVTKNGFHTHISSIWPVLRRILWSGVDVLIKNLVDVSYNGPVPLWKESYYSLVMMEKILHQFPEMFFETDLEEIWEMICQLLVHPHLWLRNISNRLVALYFARVDESCMEKLFLMRPARLFVIAASLCCQLKTQSDEDAVTLVEQNLAFAICRLHSLLGQNQSMNFPQFWFDLETNERSHLVKGFELLDPRKGKSTVAYLISDLHVQSIEQKNESNQSFLISYLVKKMGKISLEMENIQMRSIFNCFKSISLKLLSEKESSMPLMEVDKQNCAYQMLFPLYKISQGYAGKSISEEDKMFAEGIRDSIRDNMGILKYVEVCNRIEKDLKVKRDKRKHEEKLMAVVNPVRNAKRKLRIAAKHRANKKRKIMNLKMSKWMR